MYYASGSCNKVTCMCTRVRLHTMHTAQAHRTCTRHMAYVHNKYINSCEVSNHNSQSLCGRAKLYRAGSFLREHIGTNLSLKRKTSL